MWPAYVRHRVHLTYGYLAGGLGLTAAAAVAASRIPWIMNLVSRGTLPVMFLTIGTMIATTTLTHSIRYDNLVPKHMAWALHSAVMGAVLAPMCMLGGPALFRAAWYTAGIVGGCFFFLNFNLLTIKGHYIEFNIWSFFYVKKKI